MSEEIKKGVAQRRDVISIVPVEFLAENTDTLFSHASLMFDRLPGYRTYQGPPAGTDWNKPYVRRFQQGQTTILYTGSPGGLVVPAQGSVLADAISMLWAKPAPR